MTDTTQASASVPTHVKWGTRDVALVDLPNGSLVALIQRGMNHIHGNEVASAVTQRKAKAKEAGKEMSESEIAAAMEALRAEKLSAILDGKLGLRAGGGIRLAGIDRVMRDIATDTIRAAFVAHNEKQKASGKAAVPMPKGDALKAKLDQYVKNWSDKADATGQTLRQKAQARIDATKAAGSDVDDIMGDLMGDDAEGEADVA